MKKLVVIWILVMLVSACWAQNIFAPMKEVAPKLDYGVTYIPAPDGRKSTWSGGWSVAMLQGSKNQEAAYQLLRYVTGEQGQILLMQKASSLPTLKDLLQRRDLLPEQYQFFLDLLPISKSRPPIPIGALYWDRLRDAEEAVISNSQTPGPALQTVDQTVQPQMDRYCH